MTWPTAALNWIALGNNIAFKSALRLLQLISSVFNVFCLQTSKLNLTTHYFHEKPQDLPRAEVS